MIGEETLNLRVSMVVSVGVLTALVVSGFVSCSGASGSVSFPAMWSTPVQIADGEAIDVAVDGESIYVDGYSALISSLDSGATWSSVPGEYSRICASEGVVYRAVCYADAYYGGSIGLTTSTDDGATWSAPLPIVSLEGGNDGSFGIFKFGARLVLYTLDGYPGTNEIGAMVKVTWSDDLGNKWSKPVVVDKGLYVEDPFANDIVCANGVLYLVYYDQTPGFDNVEIIVARSPDMGKSWSHSVVATGPYANNPIISVDGTSSELFVSYRSFVLSPDWVILDGGVYVVRSVDGIIWTAPVKAGTMMSATDQSGFHSLVASAGKVFEAYLDYQKLDTESVYKLRISGSMDDGATWADMGDVTGRATNAVYPILAISSGKLHFFWTDYGAGNPWYDPGTVYYRHTPVNLEKIGEVTITRQRGASPSGDAQSMTCTPEKNGLLWVHVQNSGLSYVTVALYDVSSGKMVLVSSEPLLFGAARTGELDSGKVSALAGHDYVVKITPYGPRGASATVTGFYIEMAG